MKIQERDSRDGGRTGPSLFKSCERDNYTDHGTEISSPADLQVTDSPHFVNRKRTYSVADNCDVSPYPSEEELHDRAVTKACIENRIVH